MSQNYRLTLLNVHVNALGISFELRHYLSQLFHLFNILFLLSHCEFLNEISFDLVIFRLDFLFCRCELLNRKILCNEIQFLDDVSCFK